MAAARKPKDDALTSQHHEDARPARISAPSEPLTPARSPARELQAALSQELQPGHPTQSEAITGLIVGILGASWVTGLLIYATL